MNSIPPKVPQAQMYILENTLDDLHNEENHAERLPEGQSDNFGGHIFFSVASSGTAASGTSLSYTFSPGITYIPYSSVIPFNDLMKN